MEEVIKKYFCNFCLNNKCQNCMDIVSVSEKDVLTYKCVNSQIKVQNTPETFDYIIQSDNYLIKNI